MAYKETRIKLEGTQYDRRVRLTPEERALLIEDKGKLSQRQAARKYGVSKRLVQFIWNPEMHERIKAQYKERRKDGRYYKKEKHTLAMRTHRRYKRKLYDSGRVEMEAENNNKRTKQI